MGENTDNPQEMNKNVEKVETRSGQKPGKKEKTEKVRKPGKPDKPKKEKKSAVPGEALPLGGKIIGILQLALIVPVYVFMAVKAYMYYFSEDAYDHVLILIDNLRLQNIAESEGILLAGAIVFTVYALLVLVSSIFLFLRFKRLKVASMIVSIAAILAAVVFTALLLAFNGRLLYLLILIPHCGWYAFVIFYYITRLSPESGEYLQMAQEKKAVRAANKASKAGNEIDEEYEEDIQDVEEISEEDPIREKVLAESTGTEVRVSAPVKRKVVKIRKKSKRKVIDPNRLPKLAYFIAMVHTFFYGIIYMLGAVINIIATFNEDYDIMFQEFLRSLEIKNIEITQLQLRMVFIVQAAVSIAFLVSGIGLFRRSDMMRRFTVNMIITLAVVSLFSIVLQGMDAFNPYMIGYFVWFAFAGFYLNRSSLDLYFRSREPKEEYIIEEIEE